MQALAERNELTTRHGRLSFSILLFQDLAVIPILAFLPLLGPASGGAGDGIPWLDIAMAVGTIALAILGGRYLLRYVLRLMARFGTHEVFTATTLLTVVGVALLMELAGLSMALGAFLAGVLLADSEYRHELEADIEPFKGLLLGLFFIAVGMTVHIGLAIETPLTVLGLGLGLMLAKMLCLAAIARIDTPNWRTVRGTAIALSQGGEFAFVILALGVFSSLMEGRTSDMLILAVTLSMAATPLALKADDWLNARLEREPEPEYERDIEEENRVIVAGFGRVGQIVGRSRATGGGLAVLGLCRRRSFSLPALGKRLAAIAGIAPGFARPIWSERSPGFAAESGGIREGILQGAVDRPAGDGRMCHLRDRGDRSLRGAGKREVRG